MTKLGNFAKTITPLGYSFSFIIPSYNGANKLPFTFQNLTQLPTWDSHEAVVVLDGSTDRSAEILQELNLRHVKIVNQRNLGRSITRNNAVENAGNDFLFFMDDDMRLASSTLEDHAQHHLQHPNSILVGNILMDESKLDNDFLRYLGALFKKWNLNSKNKVRIDLHHFNFTAAHLSMPKSIFQQLGGFDPRLTDAEDFDLGMRALEAGIPIYYDPATVAFHDDFPTCAKYIQRQIQYKRSHMKLRDLGKNYSLFQPIKPPKGFLKTAILRLLSKPFWVVALDNERLLFLPTKWRHKLYASIVYAHTLKGLSLI